jgi:hypothetical protein
MLVLMMKQFSTIASRVPASARAHHLSTFDRHDLGLEAAETSL